MKYTTVPGKEPSATGVTNAIIKTALLAGSLDIVVALTQYYLKTGKNVLGVLKYIASAVYGKEAFVGGNGMAAIGLVFHFIIAFAWTIFFFLIYPRVSLLQKNTLLRGCCMVFSFG